MFSGTTAVVGIRDREVLVVLALCVDLAITEKGQASCCGSKCLTSPAGPVTVVLTELSVLEVRLMSRESRLEALERAGLVHPRPGEVTAELFCSGRDFFLAADKVQVKYEMLRAAVDGATVVAAAAAHGYSRGEYYLVAAAFAERGMAGLVDERRGRKGPTKLSAEIAEFLRQAPPERSGAELAREVETRFGVSLHRRTAERARRR
jgi:transposase